MTKEKKTMKLLKRKHIPESKYASKNWCFDVWMFWYVKDNNFSYLWMMKNFVSLSSRMILPFSPLKCCFLSLKNGPFSIKRKLVFIGKNNGDESSRNLSQSSIKTSPQAFIIKRQDLMCHKALCHIKDKIWCVIRLYVTSLIKWWHHLYLQKVTFVF